MKKQNDFSIVRYKHGLLTGYCLKGYEQLDINSIPFDELIHHPMEPYRLLKSTKRRTTVSFPFQSDSGTNRIFAKRYKVWRYLRKLGYLFVSPKAFREWNLGFELLRLGIKTPLPLIVAARRRGPFVCENYLITMGIEPYEPVSHLLKKLAEGESRRTMIRNLAIFIRTFHEKGIYHDDLSTAHVFAEQTFTTIPQFALIDLDNGKILKKVSHYRRMKNLFQIFRSVDETTLSLEERRFFLECYLSGEPPDVYMRDINAHSRLKIGSNII
jgi:tRNA A-37 threonylcarbamoyl transferase component Bud32